MLFEFRNCLSTIITYCYFKNFLSHFAILISEFLPMCKIIFFNNFLSPFKCIIEQLLWVLEISIISYLYRKFSIRVFHPLLTNFFNIIFTWKFYCSTKHYTFVIKHFILIHGSVFLLLYVGSCWFYVNNISFCCFVLFFMLVFVGFCWFLFKQHILFFPCSILYIFLYSFNN